MSFGNIGTLMAACGGGPQHVLTQLGDNSTAKITPVPYNDWNGFNGYLDGASKIDTAIKDANTTDKILVFAHSFGAWADYPNVYSNAASWTAANVVNYGDSYPSNIHVNYNNINLSTPDATATFGNVTFQLFQTTTVPMSGVTRNQVEPAYNRIVGPVAF
jgi:hypothetical protein